MYVNVKSITVPKKGHLGHLNSLYNLTLVYINFSAIQFSGLPKVLFLSFLLLSQDFYSSLPSASLILIKIGLSGDELKEMLKR